MYAGFEIRGVSANGSYSENTQLSPLSVSFIPLTGDKADYNGMAEAYRGYLADKFGLEKVSAEIPVSVTLLGAVYVDADFLGIPYKSLYPTTTFNGALSIVKDIAEKTKTAPAVNLVGFGLSGLDTGKPAGGLDTAAVLGSKKDIKALIYGL